MMSEKRLLDLVSQIYEAAMNPMAMQCLPDVVATHFGSESCLFHFCYRPAQIASAIPENARLPIGTANFDIAACTSYAEYYHERNEWYARGWKKGFPAVVLGEELMSRRELLRTEWADYCKLTGGMFELVGAQCLVSSDLIAAIGIHRPLGARPFNESDRRMMALVLPHLERAFQIHERLGVEATRSALAIDLLDSLSVGLVIVAADSRLLFASTVADRVLRQGQHLALRDGRLRAVSSHNGPWLDRLIAGAVRTSAGLVGGAGGKFHLGGANGSSLAILVAPMRIASLGFGLMQPAAIVIFADPDTRTHVPEERLRQLYGLTPAEIRLLTALLNGQKLAEYAGTASITYGTARIHLKRLLQKTSCHSQTDLVRTVLRDPQTKMYGQF